jgi:cytochrome P450
MAATRYAEATNEQSVPAGGAGGEVPRLAGHPILGHLGSFKNDRAGMLLRYGREHPDIVGLRMGLVRSVLVASPALVNEVLTTKEAAFVKSPGLSVFMRPLLGNGLLTSEHDFHTRQRKLLAPAFAAKRIAGYARTFGERTDRVAKTLPNDTTLDVADLTMRLTFEIVGKTLFDAEVISDASDVGAALTTAMEVSMGQLSSLIPLPPMIPTPKNLAYRRAVARLDEVVYRIIRERRAHSDDRGDVLSMLLEAKDEDGGSMSDEQIRDEAMTLFLAGHETTANALAWTFSLLAKNPDVRTRLEAEVDTLSAAPTYEDLKKLPYTLAIFKEAMRLYPPAYVLGRRVVKDVEIGGYRLKRNTIVFINILGIHRRPDLWPDPERFDPDRFLGDKEKQMPRCAYMPFGGGPRICIGNHFALMEGHVVLAALARQVRFERVSDADPELEPLVTLRPKGGLPMRVVRR